MKRISASRLGQSASRPLPLRSDARVISAKCRMGLSSVKGCIQCGMASTGVSAPEREASGGLMKKLINCACCADLVKVAMTVPMPMPQSRHKAAPPKTSRRLPLKGRVKDELQDCQRQQHHQQKQDEERRDFGDDDFCGAGRGHEELLDGAGFALLDHGGGGDQRAIQDEQNAEYAGDNEPGIDQAGVEEKRRDESGFARAGRPGSARDGLELGVNAALPCEACGCSSE